MFHFWSDNVLVYHSRIPWFISSLILTIHGAPVNVKKTLKSENVRMLVTRTRPSMIGVNRSQANNKGCTMQLE